MDDAEWFNGGWPPPCVDLEGLVDAIYVDAYDEYEQAGSFDCALVDQAWMSSDTRD